MVNMFFPLVSCFLAALVVVRRWGEGKQIELTLELSHWHGHDLGHLGCLPKGSLLSWPVPPLMATLAGVGMELTGLAEFVQWLPQKRKGEHKTLGYGKNNNNNKKTGHLDLKGSKSKSAYGQ